MRKLLIAMFALLLGTAAAARALRPDEQVLFVPDIAVIGADGSVEARIESWVYEIEDRPGLTPLLAHHLDLDLSTMTAPDRERFYARTQLFRVDSQSFKTLAIVIDGPCQGSAEGCPDAALPRSNFAGRSSLRLHLPARVIGAGQRWLRFALRMPRGDARQFRGRALLVPAAGLSLISDIDDTIKVSQVRDRQELLLNSFAREFVAVPGMAARYRELTAAPGSAVHYVSSGPIQLYPPLAEFLRTAAFPAGSVHLRESTAITNVIAGKGDSRAHKLAAIERLLSDLPGRQFLLIGDSGEADPEIYATIARAHREQIVGIRIRDVSGDAVDSPRYRNAFAELEPTLWQIFSDPASLRAP